MLVGAVVVVVLVVELDPALDDFDPTLGGVVVVVVVVAVLPVDVLPSTDCAAAISACMAAMSVWYWPRLPAWSAAWAFL